VVALGLGVIGTAFGVCIGIMHLVKGGPPVETAMGLIVLISGVTCLQPVVSCSSGSCAAGGGVSPSRRHPLVFQFLLVPLPVGVYATNVPPTRIGLTTPSVVRFYALSGAGACRGAGR